MNSNNNNNNNNNNNVSNNNKIMMIKESSGLNELVFTISINRLVFKSTSYFTIFTRDFSQLP